MAVVDYSASMIQTFEFYKVDPFTWKDNDRITTIKSATITRDSTDDTLGYCSIDGTDLSGEFYIRIYLVIIQNGYRFREPLGTFLIQTPSYTFNGKRKENSVDGYTPLIELKENQPEIGYAIEKGENALDYAYRNTRDNLRAPVVKPIENDNDIIKNDGGFVSNTDDTWLSFNQDLLSNISRHYEVTPLGEILISPDQDPLSKGFRFEYKDDGLSILYPEISLKKDLYGIPNTVYVIYSDNKKELRSYVYNNDPGSPTSSVNRGRVITKRLINPQGLISADQSEVDEFAKRTLKEASTIECEISYTHGYCPVQIGDCVRISYKRAGLEDIRATVIRQIIQCDTGCSVSETARFKLSLWK